MFEYINNLKKRKTERWESVREIREREIGRWGGEREIGKGGGERGCVREREIGREGGIGREGESVRERDRERGGGESV